MEFDWAPDPDTDLDPNPFATTRSTSRSGSNVLPRPITLSLSVLSLSLKTMPISTSNNVHPPLISLSRPRRFTQSQSSPNPRIKNLSFPSIPPMIAGRVGIEPSLSPVPMGSDSKRRRGIIRPAAGDGADASARLMTLPTVLTLGRVAAVPLLVSTFYHNGWWATTATTGIFIAAAITDWLDGYLARKMQLGTVFGAFLDPVADKLMVAAALILLCTKPVEVSVFGQVNWLLTAPSIAIIGREITMSAVREWAASQDAELLKAVAVNNLGKWKTATQMTALTILLATRDPSLAGPTLLVASGVVLLYISAALALWSLAVYMRKISGVLLN